MARKPTAAGAVPREAGLATDGPETRPPHVDEVVDRIRRHLDEGQPKKALEQVGRSNLDSAWLTNAAAVCQIRLGNAERAVELMRGLVVQGGIHLRDDIPPAFKINFAVALLAAGNLDGFLSALNEVNDAEHASARRYRNAYRQWKARRTFWERIKMVCGGSPAHPFALDFPPGELT